MNFVSVDTVVISYFLQVRALASVPKDVNPLIKIILRMENVGGGFTSSLKAH